MRGSEEVVVVCLLIFSIFLMCKKMNSISISYVASTGTEIDEGRLSVGYQSLYRCYSHARSVCSCMNLGVLHIMVDFNRF